MARTPIYHEEKKAQILQAALATFSKYGYEGTSNKLIAKEAVRQMGQPVSPALIYHYFPEGKSKLFAECIGQLPSLQHFSDFVQNNLDEPPEVFVPLLVRTYNELLKADNVLPLLRLVIAEGARQPDILLAFLSKLGPGLFQYLIGYLYKQMAAGRLLTDKPDQVAMQIIGPIIMRRVILSIMPDVMPTPINLLMLSQDDEFVASIANSVLKGLFRV